MMICVNILLKSYLLILTVTSVCLVDYGSAEVFTAIADVQNLVDAERKIVDVLRLLVIAEQTRVAAIEKYIDQFNNIFESNVEDAPKIVAHPVNAFLLVKHLTADWDQLRGLLGFDIGKAALDDSENLRKSARFPEDEDIKGAAEGFVRLQKTYKIPVQDFVTGNISGIEPSPPLNALDCYLIGHRLAVEGVHDYSVNWLEMALQKYKEETFKQNPSPIRLVDILDWLQYSYFHGGNPYRALEISESIKILEPTFPTVDINTKYYKELLVEMPQNTWEIMKNQSRPPAIQDFGGHYESLCRGEGVLSKEVKQYQRCYYETHNNPYLLLQPAKYEVIHENPDIFVLHDVALDSEIERVKEVAMTQLTRASVVKMGTKETEFAKIRISKSAFLREDIDPVIAKINAHIGHITNLDLSQAEDLQVANYGIGGHYNAHYDFFKNPNDPNTQQIENHLGDRIATFLMYMTDVDAGGATTFPRINVTLFPQKGSAAFWYNLHRDGAGDLRTLHEGCPVLSGTKWISNKWIREVGQYRPRPCGLAKDSFEWPTASDVI